MKYSFFIVAIISSCILNAMDNYHIKCNGASIKPLMQAINSKDGTALNLKHLEITKDNIICLSHGGRLYRGENKSDILLYTVAYVKPYNSSVQSTFSADGNIIAAREPFGAIQFHYLNDNITVRMPPIILDSHEKYCNIALNTDAFAYTPGNNICYLFPTPSAKVGSTETKGTFSCFPNSENISVIHYYNNIITLYGRSGTHSSEIMFCKKVSTGCEDMGTIAFSQEIDKIPLVVWHPSSLYCAFTANNQVALANLQDTFSSGEAPIIVNDRLVQDDTIQELFFASAKTLVIVDQKNIHFYYIDENELKSYPLPVYQYAKWHSLVQQLSLSSGNQILLYQFPQYN